MTNDRWGKVIIIINGTDKYSVEDTSITDTEMMARSIEEWDPFQRPPIHSLWRRMVAWLKGDPR